MAQPPQPHAPRPRPTLTYNSVRASHGQNPYELSIPGDREGLPAAFMTLSPFQLQEACILLSKIYHNKDTAKVSLYGKKIEWKLEWNENVTVTDKTEDYFKQDQP